MSDAGCKNVVMYLGSKITGILIVYVSGCQPFWAYRTLSNLLKLYGPPQEERWEAAAGTYLGLCYFFSSRPVCPVPIHGGYGEGAFVAKGSSCLSTPPLAGQGALGEKKKEKEKKSQNQAQCHAGMGERAGVCTTVQLVARGWILTLISRAHPESRRQWVQPRMVSPGQESPGGKSRSHSGPDPYFFFPFLNFLRISYITIADPQVSTDLRLGTTGLCT